MHEYYHIPDKINPAFSGLQNDNSTLLIYVPTDWNADANLSFLKKIIQALDLSLDNFHLIQVQGPHSFFQDLKDVKARRAVLFGVGPKEIGLQMELPIYEAVSIRDLTIIRADKLADIKSSKSLKLKLWTVLSKHFKP